jgi:hypothetical protein
MLVHGAGGGVAFDRGVRPDRRYQDRCSGHPRRQDRLAVFPSLRFASPVRQARGRRGGWLLPRRPHGSARDSAALSGRLFGPRDQVANGNRGGSVAGRHGRRHRGSALAAGVARPRTHVPQRSGARARAVRPSTRLDLGEASRRTAPWQPRLRLGSGRDDADGRAGSRARAGYVTRGGASGPRRS